MPENMPETFFEMLDACLTYKHRIRKSAGSILESSEFVRFHKEHEKVEELEENKDFVSFTEALADTNAPRRTKSIVIEGSIVRHMMMMKYGKFEHSVTSLLATVLVKSELKSLLDKIDHYIDTHEQEVTEKELVNNRKRLQIISIAALHIILEELKFHHV